MTDLRQHSAHNRVIEDYFRTTSSTAVEIDAANIRRSTAGLRRRIGSWLDVRGKDVLDLGSGTGELCGLVHERGARSAVGVNLSAEEIAFARDRVPVDFVCQDISEYLAVQSSNSLDRVFAMNILEHLDKDALLRVLEGVYRCLRQGGELIAMVPNATSPFGAMTRYWDITHQLAFTPGSIRQLARLVGFSTSEFRECGPVPHGLVSGIRYGLWQFLRLGLRAYLLIETASGKGGVYTSDMLFRLRKGTPVSAGGLVRNPTPDGPSCQ